MRTRALGASGRRKLAQLNYEDGAGGSSDHLSSSSGDECSGHGFSWWPCQKCTNLAVPENDFPTPHSGMSQGRQRAAELRAIRRWRDLRPTIKPAAEGSLPYREAFPQKERYQVERGHCRLVRYVWEEAHTNWQPRPGGPRDPNARFRFRSHSALRRPRSRQPPIMRPVAVPPLEALRRKEEIAYWRRQWNREQERRLQDQEEAFEMLEGGQSAASQTTRIALIPSLSSSLTAGGVNRSRRTPPARKGHRGEHADSENDRREEHDESGVPPVEQLRQLGGIGGYGRDCAGGGYGGYEADRGPAGEAVPAAVVVRQSASSNSSGQGGRSSGWGSGEKREDTGEVQTRQGSTALRGSSPSSSSSSEQRQAVDRASGSRIAPRGGEYTREVPKIPAERPPPLAVAEVEASTLITEQNTRNVVVMTSAKTEMLTRMPSDRISTGDLPATTRTLPVPRRPVTPAPPAIAVTSGEGGSRDDETPQRTTEHRGQRDFWQIGEKGSFEKVDAALHGRPPSFSAEADGQFLESEESTFRLSSVSEREQQRRRRELHAQDTEQAANEDKILTVFLDPSGILRDVSGTRPSVITNSSEVPSSTTLGFQSSPWQVALPDLPEANPVAISPLASNADLQKWVTDVRRA